jgi:hypothetical protein
LSSYSIKYCLILLLVLDACASGPKRLRVLSKNGVQYQRIDTAIDIAAFQDKVRIQYTGCGGVAIKRDSTGILIDPFFSNPRLMQIGWSLFGRGYLGKRKLSSSEEMIDYGLRSIENRMGNLEQFKAILSAHSHYDHLMDIPAIHHKLDKLPTVYVNRSGYNTCYNVLDSGRTKILEEYVTTPDIKRSPIEVRSGNKSIHIYPIQSDHNPHFKYVKFFDGNKTRPLDDYTDPWGRTRANDWLEGNVFSFLIDFLDESGGIEFRIFIQSSSCNPPAGIPPKSLIDKRKVDVALLGVVSYQFSPDYPCTLLNTISPRQIVWIHWEDFFREYSKQPKTVRGTNIPGFFELPCVKEYVAQSLLPLPGVAIEFE